MEKDMNEAINEADAEKKKELRREFITEYLYNPSDDDCPEGEKCSLTFRGPTLKHEYENQM